MSMLPEPLVLHAPIEPVWDDLRAWVDRYLARSPDEQWLHEEVVEVPYAAAGWLLREHLVGSWNLSPDEVAHLWFIGRAMGGRRQELLTPADLQEALPGRGHRPDDPPGRWVLDVLLAGGAHGAGVGWPGKSEFPPHWDDDEAFDRCEDVAQHPSATVELPDGTFLASGEREGVQLRAVVRAEGELLTAYPVRGPGVVHNPLSEEQRPAVAVLEALLDDVPLAADVRRSFDELVAVGEWPHVVGGLLALDLAWTHQQRVDLAELHEVCDLEIPPWFLNGTG